MVISDIHFRGYLHSTIYIFIQNRAEGETKLRAMEEALFLPNKTLLMHEVNKRSTSGINY